VITGAKSFPGQNAALLQEHRYLCTYPIAKSIFSRFFTSQLACGVE
jgi:hypothetical protein